MGFFDYKISGQPRPKYLHADHSVDEEEHGYQESNVGKSLDRRVNEKQTVTKNTFVGS